MENNPLFAGNAEAGSQQVINNAGLVGEMIAKTGVTDLFAGTGALGKMESGLECTSNFVSGPKTEEEKVEWEAKAQMLKEAYRVSMATPYPAEQCLLEVDGVPFLAKGDIHAVKAKQKTGKTHAISIMVSAILGNQWHRLKGLIKNARVLFIDTEQKAADTQAVYGKILRNAGLPEKDIFERFQVFTLRKASPQERTEALRVLMYDFRPDIVFVDGIVDLSIDFNEVSDSQSLIQMLMSLSSDYDCAVVSVLHTNKAHEDHNMRGHLGTMLAQKAGNILECVRGDGDCIVVRSADSRHAPVPEWSFGFDENGGLICADDNYRQAQLQKAIEKTERQALEKRKTEEERLKVCRAIFAETVGQMSIANLKKAYQEKTGLSDSSSRRHVLDLIEAGLLKEDLGVVRLASDKEMNEE